MIGVEIVAQGVVAGIGNITFTVVYPEFRFAAGRDAARFIAETCEKGAPVHFLRVRFVRIEYKLNPGLFPVRKVGQALHVIWYFGSGLQVKGYSPAAIIASCPPGSSEVEMRLVIRNPSFVKFEYA